MLNKQEWRQIVGAIGSLDARRIGGEPFVSLFFALQILSSYADQGCAFEFNDKKTAITVRFDAGGTPHDQK